MKNWEHDELAEDLADIKCTGFLNVPLGSVWGNSHTQRADVIEVKPSYTRFCISIYEIKISRADFQSDIRSDKWKGYLPHCHRFYFASPAGVLAKEDIPKGAGLIVRGDRGWNTLIGAPVMDNDIPQLTLMSLLFSREREYFRSRKRYRIWDAQHSSRYEKHYKCLGKKIGDALRNFDEYEAAKHSFERLKERTRQAIAEGLGIDYNPESWDSPEWELSAMVRKIKQKEGI